MLGTAVGAGVACPAADGCCASASALPENANRTAAIAATNRVFIYL
jgi:hypothetical protein